MIPSNILQRTVQISFGESSGTAFTLDIEGRQYLITARHVLSGIKKVDTIQLQWNKEWHSMTSRLVGYGSSKSDIAVLALERQISPNLRLSSEGQFFLGQDAYFLGFPYGLRMDIGEVNNLFPNPLVKKAIISAFCAPVFAVEVRSEFDYGKKAEDSIAKKRGDYFAAGTVVLWEVDLLSADTIKVYRASDPNNPTIYRRGEIAEAEPAVPGWTMPVDDLFD